MDKLVSFICLLVGLFYVIYGKVNYPIFIEGKNLGHGFFPMIVGWGFVISSAILFVKSKLNINIEKKSLRIIREDLVNIGNVLIPGIIFIVIRTFVLPKQGSTFPLVSCKL
ncbi:MAG: hypothetical protein AB1523_06065 [Bacillota bacterium]